MKEDAPFTNWINNAEDYRWLFCDSFWTEDVLITGKSLHQLTKKSNFKVEKDELQGALEEAESALEQEENRVARAQMDIAAARADIERRLHDKEEEFEATRKNFARAIDSMSASLEGETR